MKEFLIRAHVIRALIREYRSHFKNGDFAEYHKLYILATLAFEGFKIYLEREFDKKRVEEFLTNLIS